MLVVDQGLGSDKEQPKKMCADATSELRQTFGSREGNKEAENGYEVMR